MSYKNIQANAAEFHVGFQADMQYVYVYMIYIGYICITYIYIYVNKWILVLDIVDWWYLSAGTAEP